MIDAYLTDPIFILRHATPDAWNQAPAPTREATLGYVEQGSRLIRSITGEQVASEARVLMATDATLTHRDEIEHDGKAHTILRIERAKDFSDVGMWVYLA